jgi:hypothetical protein
MKPDPRFPGTKHWEVLEGFIKQNGWKRGAEVGLLKGKTTRYLLEHCPGLFLFGIDQWKHLPPSNEPGAEHYQKFDMQVCESTVMELARQFPDRLSILKGDSAVMAAQVPDGSLDFVFIDAAHTTSQTARNIEAWLAKIRGRGWLTGHDWNWPSVAKALDAELVQWEKHPEWVWSFAVKGN